MTISILSPKSATAISWSDYPDNYSQSIVFYFYGCGHGCKGCHNSGLQQPDMANYLSWTVEQLYNHLLTIANKNQTNKLTFLGGDCLFKRNLVFTKAFLQYNTFFDICIYTGYNIEYVKNNNITGFTFIKCGLFDETKYQLPSKDDQKMVFASSNQKLYNEKYNLLTTDGVYLFQI
jgi:organic radical activating enzyme